MAGLLADHHILEFTLFAIQELWQKPHIYTTHNPSNSSFHLCYPHFANTSICFFVNKSLNPSSYFAASPTLKYGYLCLMSSIEGTRDIVIHNMYCTEYLSPTLSDTQPP